MVSKYAFAKAWNEDDSTSIAYLVYLMAKDLVVAGRSPKEAIALSHEFHNTCWSMNEDDAHACDESCTDDEDDEDCDACLKN